MLDHVCVHEVALACVSVCVCVQHLRRRIGNRRQALTGQHVPCGIAASVAGAVAGAAACRCVVVAVVAVVAVVVAAAPVAAVVGVAREEGRHLRIWRVRKMSRTLSKKRAKSSVRNNNVKNTQKFMGENKM
jgi:hypothetical protein